MKILLAGPGTGKTTKIKGIIDSNFSGAQNIQVLSFTNATVNDLKESFDSYQNVKCSTLHGFALRINMLKDKYILSKEEKEILSFLSKKLSMELKDVEEFLNSIDFNEMIKQCVSFIKSNPEYIKEIIGDLDLLLVDEFQDFNKDEQELVMLLSKNAKETIILGDDDQSIYGFKDADPDGIINLYNDSFVEKIPHDNVCHRCPDNVVDYCTKLLQKNKNRVPKEWKKSGKSGDVFVKQFMKNDDCDQYIIDEINKIKLEDANANILILSPVGFAVETLRAKMTLNAIVFNDCWKEKTDKELLSKIWWLNAIFSENKVLFIVFLLKYYNNISKSRFIKYITECLRNGLNENDFINDMIKFKYLPEGLSKYLINKPTLEDFINDNKDFELLKEFVDEENLEESVLDLINNVNPKKDFQKNEINLMSIHKSKGLQADHVFITGLVSGILPNGTYGLDTIEAQRRLLFVGMSRSQKNLYLISTIQWDGKDISKVDKKQFEYKFMSKKYYGKTSKFVEEIINS